MATGLRMTPHFTRNFSIDVRGQGDAIEASLSSEFAVDRPWGREVLLHTPEAVDLSRGALPLLESHDMSRLPLGSVENLRVSGRKLRGTLRFGSSSRAQEVRNDVMGGIIQSISIGYRIETAQNVGDEIHATRWQPYEASLVSVPADPTVGIGRSMQGITTMETTTTPKDETPTRSQRIAAKKSTASDLERINDIEAIGRQMSHYDGDTHARDFIREGRSVEEFTRFMLEKIETKPLPSANTLMSYQPSQRDEMSRYSVVRAIQAAVTGDWRNAGFEREVSREMELRSGRAARSLFVPLEALAPQRRDQTVGTATAGGNLVQTVHGGFIELLRRRSTLLNLATWMPGLSGNVDLPRQTGASTVHWVGESQAASESQLAFDKIELRPHSVSGYIDISRRLLIQSEGTIEQIVKDDLSRQIGEAVESAAIAGTGLSNQPLGLMNQSGVSAVPIGTNGGAPLWSHLLALETAVSVANADVGAMMYLTTPKVRGKLRATETVSGSGEFIWKGAHTPGEGSIAGYRAVTSTGVPSNLTKGSGTGLSAVLFGDFSQMIIGQWGAVDLLVDPYSMSSTGTIRVVAFFDVDVGIRHPESFAIIRDAETN